MVSISKLSGAGNSFLIVDLRTAKLPRAIVSRRNLAREICDSHHSIGADGLLFLQIGKGSDLHWDFYNADGSTAEMCGNAARCVGRYIMSHPHGINDDTFTIMTGAGVISVTTPSRIGMMQNAIVPVLVDMPIIKSYKTGISTRVGGKKVEFDYVDSGVPHTVIRHTTSTNLLKNLPKNVDKFGEIVNSVRQLTQFKHTGVNVTFYVKKSAQVIESFTFERGVDGYTMACGTGAVAAACSFFGGSHGTIQVRVPGGHLQVKIDGQSPQLLGPALYIADFEYYHQNKNTQQKYKRLLQKFRR